MYLNKEIAKDVFYVGVNDRLKAKFENMIPLSHGVSYNSYLIIDEKVALIDAVEIGFGDIFIEQIQSQLKERKIDYIIINHMEPDHSGALTLIRQYYPDITIVGNKKTLEMVNGYYSISTNVLEIKENETLSLGKHNLRFFLTPMVHWPETMMTFDTYENILFSGDAFGCFGTLDGGVTDTAINTDRYWEEMRLYYANIVGKYGSPVQRAIQKITPFNIKMICSTHGPIWIENVEKAISLFEKMSRYESEEGVVIAYGSMYGNTEKMAETIARGVVESGIKNVVMHNVSKSDASVILRDIFKYRGLIIGSPTYSNELHPEIQTLLNKIETRQVKKRDFGCFGSYSWAGVAVKKLGEFGEKMKWRIADISVEEKMALKNDNYLLCLALGKKMGELIRTECEEGDDCK